MQYQESFVTKSETYVTSSDSHGIMSDFHDTISDSHVPTSATYVPTPQPYAPPAQPHFPPPQPYSPPPQTYITTPEPYIPKSEAYISTSEQPNFASDSQNSPSETPDSLTRSKEFLNDYWVYEIIACIVSLGTLAAIFGVLHAFNGKDVNSWSHWWSLSSMIQLLATFSQGALAVPLGSSISQLKWVWYKQSRKLTDLDAFDQSSRGPMGSVQLLFSRPFKFLGAFGALIMISTLAFHTLIQNAITTEIGQIQYDYEGGAVYPQGNNYSLYNDYSTGDTLGDQNVVLNMLAYIDYGMYYDLMGSDTSTVQTIASCDSGNCNWDHVQTLSVCSQCADISSSIGNDRGYYTLYSTQLAMDEEIGLVSSLGDTHYPDPTAIPGVGPLIIHLTTMARSSIDENPVGVDCALWWCVRYEDNVVMENFTITHQDITSWTDTSASAKTTYQQDEDIVLTSPKCYDKFGNTTNPAQCTKTVSARAHLGIQNFFKNTFTGEAIKNTSTGGLNINNEFIQLIYSSTAINDTLADTMRIYMDNIGFSMTSNIRQSAPQSGINTSSGLVNFWVTVYHIRWAFLIVPMLLVIAGILLMIITIFKSRGQEKWKSSLLPLLFHIVVERPDVIPHKLSEINALAQKIEVKLETGRRFSASLGNHLLNNSNV